MENNISNDLGEALIEKNNQSGISDAIDFAKLFHVLKSSLIYVLVIFPLIFVSAYLYVRYTKPMYESSSVIKLKEKQESQVLGLKMGRQPGNIATLSGEIEIIRSQMIVDEVIKDEGLQVSYYEYGKFLNDEKFHSNAFYVDFRTDSNNVVYNSPFDLTFESNASFTISYYQNNASKITRKGQVGKPIEIDGFNFTIRRTKIFSEEHINVPYFFRINSSSSLANYIRTNLFVSILNPTANTIQLKFKDNNPYKAAHIVNSIDSIYLEMTLESKRLEQEQVINFINEQLDNTAKSLENSEIKLEDFVRKSGTNNPSSDFSLIKDRLEVLNEEKLGLRLEGEMLDEIRKSLLSDSAQGFVPSVSNLEDNQLKQEINALNEAYKELAKVKGTTHSNTHTYRSKVKDVENLETSVLEYVLENRKNLSEQIYAVNEKIQGLHDDFLGLPSKSTELTRLKRFYDLWEKFYLLLIEKRVQYGILKAGAVPEFVILSPASYGDLLYPVKLTVYSVAGVLATLFSFLLIAVRFLLHNKVLTVNELEKSIKAPVLGMIPAFTTEKMEYSALVINRYPKAAVTEALRSVRTNVDFICPNKKTQLITVTSTVSGEGKTFVAINLGGILAISGKKVVVLDLDMRKPKLHVGFGTDNERGMSTLLIQKDKLSDCIRRSDQENLDFISAGPLPPNPAELILKPEFDELIEELYKSYDVVIVDTPPVGLVTDGLLVMKKADVPIYVVRSGYSQRRVDQNINNLYQSGRFNNLSVILNAVEKSAGYGSGYGYGYGYGSDHGYYIETN